MPFFIRINTYPMDTPPDRPSVAAGVTDRGDPPPRGFLATGWPLAAAALILAMLVHACMPVAPSPPAAASAIGVPTSS
ncbi:MAG TPA: hypothetical protein VLA28_02690 [Afifellaceae bacterium]|nr:hypothetical protein [Afifellaceae bacterium]